MEENKKKSYIRYNDTDSAYMEITSILDKFKLPLFDEDQTHINPKVKKVCSVIENELNKGIKAWGEKELNSQDCRFKFKMEAIADKAFFIKKKKYILHVIDDEGFTILDEDKKWKYKGIILASATMPAEVKPLIESVVRELVMTGSKSISDDLYFKTFDTFSNLPIESIAQNKSVNKFDEYVEKCSDWNTGKGMLAHARGAYYYNRLLDDLDLNDKYTKIKQSDKIKFLYIKTTNRYGIDIISYCDNYPKEFESLFEIDMNKMFLKGVKDVVNQFYAAMGWSLVTPNKQVKIDVIAEFFS